MEVTAIIGSGVRAGFPSPALDYMEERIDIGKVLISNPLSTFIIETEGDSMTGAFIPQKARLLVDRAVQATSGMIVLAVLDGEFTVKYLKSTGQQCWLLPANPRYRPIEILPGMDFRIWGVVTAIIIQPDPLPSCMP
ncbi:hypothetical protein GCM10027051_36400 [Niabella terrae]